MKQRKIDYLSIHDSLSKASWSGLNYFIWQALQAAADEVKIISGMQAEHTTMLKLRYRISHWMGRNFYYDLTTSYGKQYAKAIEERVTDEDSVLFTMNSQLLPYLKLKNKVVLYNDATFANLYGYYDYFSNLNWFERREALRNERRAMQRADLLLFASAWAAHSAINDFGADPRKVHVIPFGANLSAKPAGEEIGAIIRARDLATVKLLFVGYDYDRKGGSLAVEVAAALNATGVPTILTMVGINDFKNRHLPGFVVDGGILDKEVPEEEAALQEHFRQSHFFIMPSSRECYGLVFAEACAFGLPVLAIDTGGVATIVKSGYNGWLLHHDEKADNYCRMILKCRSDLAYYQQLCSNARTSFEQELNWSVVSSRMKELIWQ